MIEKLHDKWKNMKSRCNNPKCSLFYKYGGRGIKICDRWQKYKNFEEDLKESYLAHVEEYGEENTSLDRRDNNGNYEPSNCYWATWIQQNNNKRNVRHYEFRGKIYTCRDLCSVFGEPNREKLRQRLRNHNHDAEATYNRWYSNKE